MIPKYCLCSTLLNITLATFQITHSYMSLWVSAWSPAWPTSTSNVQILLGKALCVLSHCTTSKSKKTKTPSYTAEEIKTVNNILQHRWLMGYWNIAHIFVSKSSAVQCVGFVFLFFATAKRRSFLSTWFHSSQWAAGIWRHSSSPKCKNYFFSVYLNVVIFTVTVGHSM